MAVRRERLTARERERASKRKGCMGWFRERGYATGCRAAHYSAQRPRVEAQGRLLRSSEGCTKPVLGGDGRARGTLVGLAHIEHIGGLDVHDPAAILATDHRGDDLDTLLTLADHAAGVQPGVKSAHV